MNSRVRRARQPAHPLSRTRCGRDKFRHVARAPLHSATAGTTIASLRSDAIIRDAALVTSVIAHPNDSHLNLKPYHKAAFAAKDTADREVLFVPGRLSGSVREEAD